MYKEKHSGNYYSDSMTNVTEIKEIALDFTENLLALIDGEILDSIILNANDTETKLYFKLLPLFEDVVEIMNKQIIVKSIAENNEININVDINYISGQMEKKNKRIDYKLYLQSNDSGSYDIIAAA